MKWFSKKKKKKNSPINKLSLYVKGQLQRLDAHFKISERLEKINKWGNKHPKFTIISSLSSITFLLILSLLPPAPSTPKVQSKNEIGVSQLIEQNRRIRDIRQDQARSNNKILLQAKELYQKRDSILSIAHLTTADSIKIYSIDKQLYHIQKFFTNENKD